MNEINKAIDCVVFNGNNVNIKFNRRFTKMVTVEPELSQHQADIKNFHINFDQMAGDDFYDLSPVTRNDTLLVVDRIGKQFTISFENNKVNIKYV